jgi:hypothetical protein
MSSEMLIGALLATGGLATLGSIVIIRISERRQTAVQRSNAGS